MSTKKGKNEKDKKKEMNIKEPTELNRLIIQEAVNQFKEGRLKSGLDVENFLDGLLQPLMQTLLDAELENHLQHPRYEHSKIESQEILETDTANLKL